ncbi:hypothetical protein L6R50_09490 [Myxococcota bacterium]|nr:hypothetical protein [Myxococcota bacterium]
MPITERVERACAAELRDSGYGIDGPDPSRSVDPASLRCRLGPGAPPPDPAWLRRLDPSSCRRAA